MEYSIQTKRYEGPMELLLDLIQRNKIEITDISIVEITEQYLDYIENMGKFDLDLTSDFIDMASRLLQIKSRYILYLKYNGEEEADPRKELVQKIEEYKKFRSITEIFKENIKEYDDRFYRQKAEYIKDEDLDLSGVDLELVQKMAKKLFKVLDESREAEEFLNKNEKLKKIVNNRNISVESRIVSIRSILKIDKKISFYDIINKKEKNEVIANFLAILELIKLKEIIVKQGGAYDEIIIESKEKNEEIVIEEKNTDEFDKIEKKALRRLERKFENTALNE